MTDKNSMGHQKVTAMNRPTAPHTTVPAVHAAHPSSAARHVRGHLWLSVNTGTSHWAQGLTGA